MTEIQTEMPTDVFYGKVVGRFILAVADHADVDRLPDAVPAVGSVTFSPVLSNMKLFSPVPTTVVKQPIRCSLDDNGYLKDPDGNDGVWLVVGQYRVNYQLQNVTIATHVIDVLSTNDDVSPLDLTNALPPGGPSLTVSQYSDLSTRIDAVKNSVKNGVVTSVNGNQGVVNLTAADLDTMTNAEILELFNGIDIPDAPVLKVNNRVGMVTLTAEDVDTYNKEYIDDRFASSSAVRGPWNSAQQYVAGDMVTIDNVLWYATEDNLETRPVQDVTINPVGSNGGPGSYDLSQMFGAPQQILSPIRLNRDVLVGSLSFLVAHDGLPACEVGLVAVLPVASQPVVPITALTSTPAIAGSGWKSVVLDDPVFLQADTDYWIFIKAPSGTANLNGHFGKYFAYSGAMVAPTNSDLFIRGSDVQGWAYTDRNNYTGIGEMIPQVWEPLADLTGLAEAIDFPVDSVNGMTGTVELTPADIGAAPAGALTKAVADGYYAPIGSTGGDGGGSVTPAPMILIEPGVSLAGQPSGLVVFEKQPLNQTWDFKQGVLPDGWTELGSSSETFDATGMTTIIAPGRGYYIPAPAASDFYFEVSLESDTNLNGMVGPGLFDAAGSGRIASLYNGSAGLMIGPASAYNYYGGDFADIADPRTVPVRLRIRRSGTTLYAGSSRDGGNTWTETPGKPQLGATRLGVYSIYTDCLIKISQARLIFPNTGKAKGWWDGNQIQPLA